MQNKVMIIYLNPSLPITRMDLVIVIVSSRKDNLIETILLYWMLYMFILPINNYNTIYQLYIYNIILCYYVLILLFTIIIK